MTISRLGAGDGYTYLTKSVAVGDGDGRGMAATDYYLASGNPAGRWLGTGAEVLGVEGTVSTAQMHRLYGLGLHPETGAQLGRRFQLYKTIAERVADKLAAAAKAGVALTEQQVADLERTEVARGERQAVAGFDLTFSPVKSVSLAWALASPDVAEQLAAAHHAAVEHTIGWLERDVAFARAGTAGVAQVDVAGVAVAAYDHRTSRAGDPDLHTHAVVSNKVLARLPDGKSRWLTLDSQALYKATVAASERYNRVLEDEVGRRLGWTFEPRADQDPASPTAIRELAGTPLALIKGFSRRRAAVEKRYAELLNDYHSGHGHTPPRAVQFELAQQATLETRQAKVEGETHAEERARWAAQAQAMLSPRQWEQVTAQLAPGVPLALATEADVDDTLIGELAAVALEDVTDRRSTWTVRHAQAAAYRALRELAFATPQARERVAGRVVAAMLPSDGGGARVLRLDPPELVAPPAELTRASGESVFTAHAGTRYATAAQMEAEERLLAHARRIDAPAVPDVAVSLAQFAAAEAGTPLAPDQSAAVTALATSPRGLGLLIGPAGTGKTTTVRAIVEAWGAGGNGRVWGLAPTAVAAAVLKRETGMGAASTIHSWQTSESELLEAGDLVVIDEAGMVGTRRLLDVVDRAQRAGAKVIAIGDHRQLGAIESGGALRLLAVDEPAAVAELTSVWRFADPSPKGPVVRIWEAQASLGVRVGEVTALDPYFTHGRVSAGAEAVLTDRLYEAWRAEEAAGLTSVMLAASNELVAELGQRARADLVAAGRVEAAGVQLADGNLAGRGDTVVTRLNRRLLTVGDGEFVKNGDLWEVESRLPDGGLAVRHLGHGGRIDLPAGYVAEHVEQGYAMTVHRAQGSTVDTAHLLVDGNLSRELLYVGVTRGRRSNMLHVVTDHVLDVDVERCPDPDTIARKVLTDVLAREGGDRSATETIREAWAAAGTVKTLLSRYLYASELVDPAAEKAVVVSALTAADVDAVLAAPAWPALASRIRLLSERGVNTARLLTDTLADRGLDGAEDPAAVLHHRLGPVLTETRPTLGDWLPAAPTADGEVGRYLTELREQMASRADSLAQVAAAERPAWVASLPAPMTGHTEAWETLVGRVAAYREAYDVTGPDPLGPVPDEPRQAEAHALLRAQLEHPERWAGTRDGDPVAWLEAARQRAQAAEAAFWTAQRDAGATPRPVAAAQLEHARSLLERLEEAEGARALWEEAQLEALDAAEAAGAARAAVGTVGRWKRGEAAARATEAERVAAEAVERAREAGAWRATVERALPAEDARPAARADAERTLAAAAQLSEEARVAAERAREAATERAAVAAAERAAAAAELAAAETAAQRAGVPIERTPRPGVSPRSPLERSLADDRVVSVDDRREQER